MECTSTIGHILKKAKMGNYLVFVVNINSSVFIFAKYIFNFHYHKNLKLLQ
jgi:hypothetical protein